ncbi:MAG: DNA polymerase III subunit beta [Candidatus Schekmanbacteria bacterium RBG_13_48_7]|uniref:Beta sliding clamp n=1 Tax=Candidatus Schekmanbacteria bacterium RBG_13_48_7 TaxID=1817878 RepID=A0A1F7S8H7_9BACT|nr:MAG: DNA polymerase III subunit beta [Candidatus Schekmanbacteria bacterium RBG_13_48_7]
MKINVKQNTLAKYLQMLQGIIERKHTIPILSNILIDATDKGFFLIATDLDVGMKIQCEAKIEENGSITIPGKRLNDIFRELPQGSEVEIMVEGNNLVNISSGTSLYRVVGLPSEDYPSFPSFETIEFYPFPVNEAIEMVSQTLFAASLDEGRSVLNGVLMEVGKDFLKMIATDGHRLSIRKKESKTKLNKQLNGESMIIPRKALRELIKILADTQKECSIGFNENKIIFQTEIVQLFSRKIEGKFPNYNNVIPKSNDKEFKINKDVFISSIKRVSLMSDIKSRGVLFHLQNNLLTMKSSNPEIGDGKEDVVIDYKGEEIDIMFNANYIAEGLAVIPEKEVLILLGGKKSPALIKIINSEDFTYIVMPMQLDQE